MARTAIGRKAPATGRVSPAADDRRPKVCFRLVWSARPPTIPVPRGPTTRQHVTLNGHRFRRWRPKFISGIDASGHVEERFNLTVPETSSYSGNPAALRRSTYHSFRFGSWNRRRRAKSSIRTSRLFFRTRATSAWASSMRPRST